MCGIVGIYSHDPVAAELQESLIHLQHRGQDAAGIMTCDSRFHSKHGLGLARDIFNDISLTSLKGTIGIAHARYPTAGSYSETDTQPLWITDPQNMALAHNGNLVNAQSLAVAMRDHATLDSGILLRLFADGLSGAANGDDETLFFNQLTQAVSDVFNKVEGSYSVVSVVLGQGLIAFRDPHGIRPLVYGERVRANGEIDYIFASETTPFYALGFEPRGDIAPGEVVFVGRHGRLMRKVVKQASFNPCVFEYIYFARPDSILDEVSVYRARLRMGQNLAKRWRIRYPDVIPDVVIPAPFTANTAALSFAHELGVRYSEGLYKNPFIGRTFIMPNQQARARGVRQKLTPQRTEIENKKVLIVDDSIVRGTTSYEIVKMVREYGATEINFVSTSPPIQFPCFYGIDIPSRQELIAATHTLEEIRTFLGVDRLLYQSHDDLVEAVTRRGEHGMARPCMACMDGVYVSGHVTEKVMCEKAKQREMEKGSVVPA